MLRLIRCYFLAEFSRGFEQRAFEQRASRGAPTHPRNDQPQPMQLHNNSGFYSVSQSWSPTSTPRDHHPHTHNLTHDDVTHASARRTIAFADDVSNQLRQQRDALNLRGFGRQISAPHADVTDDVFDARAIESKSHDAAAIAARRSRSFAALDDDTTRDARAPGFNTPQPKIIKYCSQV